MSKPTRNPPDIRQFVIENVAENPRNITRVTAEHFGISRATAIYHVNALVSAGTLRATGRTRARQYTLTPLVQQFASLAVTPHLEEDVTWQEAISPYLGNVESNVRNICQYGFTEMVNNVVSHSNADTMTVSVTRTAARIRLTVSDNGVGVFKKVQQTLGLKDPRHALLELSKGKLTSDPQHHSGEGIFFTSRMFDEFSIGSGDLFYWRQFKEDDWLIEVRDNLFFDGTRVSMEISPNSRRMTMEVFDEYSTAEDEIPIFSRTHVPVALAKYPQEELISRSQARRVLARFDRFSEVLLDFQGVELIGQGFADEIFRIFRRDHPETRVLWINTVKGVERMIKRANYAATQEESSNGSLQPA